VTPPRRPPPTQRAYDVCVVGSQLGGVAAAALLARRGFRVLHLDHDGLGGHYEEEGWLLPWAPSLLPSPRVFPAGEAVLAELGLTTDLTRQLEPCVPDLQVILPRARLDLVRDPAARRAELQREWPADAPALEAALEEALRLFDAEQAFLGARPPLPPRGLRRRWQLSRARRLSPSAGDGPPVPLAELGDHPLARALRATYPFLAHLDGAPPRLGLVRVIGAVLRGTHRFPGGEVGLREVLRRRVAESRGDLLGSEEAPAIAESLEVERGRVTAVRLAGSDAVYTARAFVSATDTVALRRLVPGGGEKLARQLDQSRPAQRLLSVNWVVPAAALPGPLGPTALASGFEGTPGGAVLLQVHPAIRRNKKGIAEPSGADRVLTAGAFVPTRGRDREEDLVATEVERLRAAVASFLPFFDRHVIHQSVPLLARGADRRGSRLLAHPLYEIGPDRLLGVTGLPTRSAVRNLFFAGREVVPGLGLEGELHAGLQAADVVEAWLGKKARPR
jgi:phytoene dehydrogenase-like protein